MFFFYSLAVPKTTSSSSPKQFVLRLAQGLLNQVWLIFPLGSARLVSLTIRRGEHMVFPSRGSDPIKGHGDTFTFDPQLFLYDEPYQLEAYAWNDSASFDHTVYAAFNILERGLFI